VRSVGNDPIPGVSPESLAPARPDTTCANCGAALVADQRYCLACGQPCSPVRLAFLDVLEGDRGGTRADGRGWTPALDASNVGYAPMFERPERNLLRRYSGLLGLLSVLLLCLITGLLVGHWVTQSKAPQSGPQIVKIEGLAGLPAAAASSSPTSASPGAAAATSGKPTVQQEAEESKEAAKETPQEKAPPPPPVKVSPSKLQKLTTTTGKKHQEEVNALGAQPIETG
jgi:hypothetical protein